MATAVVDPAEKKTMSKMDVLRYLDLILERSEKKHDEFLQLMCDFKMQKIHLQDLLTKVKQLFKYNRDLIQGFNAFLPRQCEIQLPISEKKSTEIEDTVCFVNSVKDALEGDYMQFLTEVSRHRCTEMSYYSFYGKMAALLKGHRDLKEQIICFFPDEEKKMSPRCQSPKSKKRSRNLDSTTEEQQEQEKKGRCSKKKDQCFSNGKKDPCKPSSVPEILKYQGESHSYKFLPEDQRPAPTSESTELDTSVLNYGLVLEPYEGYSPKPKHQSLREERSNMLEDDMFGMDMLLGSVIAAAQGVNKLLEKRKANEKANKPESPICAEEELSCLNLRCIEHLYGEYGLNVLDALHEDPGRVLPLLAVRLRQKGAELSECRQEFKEEWAKVSGIFKP